MAQVDTVWSGGGGGGGAVSSGFYWLSLAFTGFHCLPLPSTAFHCPFTVFHCRSPWFCCRRRSVEDFSAVDVLLLAGQVCETLVHFPTTPHALRPRSEVTERSPEWFEPPLALRASPPRLHKEPRAKGTAERTWKRVRNAP